jgi:hypothetical protein
MTRRKSPPPHPNVPVHSPHFPYRFTDWAAI